MRTLGFALTILFTIAAGAAKHPKETSDLQKNFDAEFLGRQFVSKIPLAGYLQQQMENGTLAHRLVDTEYGQDGSINYLVRTGTVENPGFFPSSSHVQLQQVNKVYPPGTQFWVVKNEIKKDRIEIWLVANSSGPQTVENYAKLKLMLTDGYQRTAVYEDLLVRVSDILRIERLERIKALASERRSLESQVSTAETRFKGASDPAIQYAAGQQLRTVLEQIIQNGIRYQQAGGKPFENGQYQQGLDEIQRALPALQAQSHELRVQGLQQQLDNNTRQLSSLRDRLQRPVTTSSDEEGYKTAFGQFSETVSNRDAIILQFQQENIPISESEMRLTQEARQQVSVFQNRISTDGVRITLINLDRQYKVLGGRHNELLDRMLQSSGPEAEKTNREKFLSNLEEMRQNRLKAQQLGSKTAASELNKLQAEISRMQH
jgi:hypothetical protein